MKDVPSKDLTVLIIEDDIPLRRALKDKFSHEGFTVLEAKNGKEGLQFALTSHPGIILLDIIMPVMDGIAMLVKLRKDSWGKTAIVMVLSNLSDQEKVAEALTHGTFDYLIKSDWKLEDVVKKVKGKLGIQ